MIVPALDGHRRGARASVRRSHRRGATRHRRILAGEGGDGKPCARRSPSAQTRGLPASFRHGRRVPDGVGVVFREDACFPWLTVADSIAAGLRRLKLSDAERRSRVSGAIELMELGEFARS